MKQDFEKTRKRMYMLAGAAIIVGICAYMMLRTFDVTVDGRLQDSYRKGETVTLDTYVSEGEIFTGWTVEKGDITLADASAAKTSFTMPARDVEVRANFEDIEYSAEVENGSGAGAYTKYETVEISADAAPEGQIFSCWTVEKGDITLADAYAETTSFTMPTEDVKVTAEYISIHDGQMKNAWIEACNALEEKYGSLLTYSLEDAGELLLESGLQIEGENGEYQDEVYITTEELFGNMLQMGTRVIHAQSPDGSYSISLNSLYNDDINRCPSWIFLYHPGQGSGVISGPLQEMLSFMATPDPWEAFGISQEMLDWADKNIEDESSENIDSEWSIAKSFDETDKYLSISKEDFEVRIEISADNAEITISVPLLI